MGLTHLCLELSPNSWILPIPHYLSQVSCVVSKDPLIPATLLRLCPSFMGAQQALTALSELGGLGPGPAGSVSWLPVTRTFL